ncbi:MAG: MBL fold metallo-hydrolase [Pseudolabrys sp.]|nr:MBL fold metallo-hydrolase [Pseudolabrys sp.]MDP2299023.1 MBL fold metallo-hydrolase [Pseudolabrys sp.]
MPASMQGEMQPAVYRFKFGGFEVATMLDSKGMRDGLHPLYGANAEAAEVQALARANNIDPQRIEHPNIPTLVNTGRELILFDTGNGMLPRDYEALKARMPMGNLVARLAQLGHKPEDIDVVVLTHGHPDHIGGLSDGGRPVYPNARYVFGAAEYDFWMRNEGVREARKFNRELFVKMCEPLAARSTFIKPGDAVASGITAVDAFGHAPGLMAFHVESEGKQLMITADTFTHYVMGVQRPDWHFDMDDDKDKAVTTRKRILDRLAAEKMFAVGFHMPFPGIGWVDKSAGDFRWVPHSYQMNL